MSAAIPPDTVPVSPTEVIAFAAAEGLWPLKRAASTFVGLNSNLNPDLGPDEDCPLAEGVARVTAPVWN